MSDLISRQAAIDLVESFYKIDKSVLNIMVFNLKQLPPIQPDKDLIHLQKEQAYMKGYADGQKPRKGEWIWDGDIFDLEKEYICSECRCYALGKDGNQIRSSFCHNCGADMREG